MMLAELTVQAKAAVGNAKLVGSATPAIVWGASVAEVIKFLAIQAVEIGREYRDELEQAAKAAVDSVVALDIPFVPASVEDPFDEVARAAGYAAVDAVLNAILGKATE